MRSQADAAPGFVHVPEFLPERGRFTLSDEESHYVARVCRAHEGDTLSGSDGRGTLLRLRVAQVRKSVEVEVDSFRTAALDVHAHVLCGAPEGQRADWLVEKLAELGVRRFTPIDCERADYGRAAGRRARWQRLAVAALKQSQSAFLMEIDEPKEFGAALDLLAPGAVRWWAHPGGQPLPRQSPGPSMAVVGPSRGFSDRERMLLEERLFTQVRLAAGRLRAETAAIAWAAWWAAAVADS